MDDLTSSALIGLVRAAFARRGLADAATGTEAVARAPAGTKRALLEEGFARFGADGVLAVGREVLEVPWDPTLAVLRRARSPEDLVARWCRLERYYHSRHRTRVVDRGAASLVLEHHALSGPAPALVEDMLIAGLVAALLLDAGALGLDAWLGETRFLDAGEPIAVADTAGLDARRLRVHWQGFATRRPIVAETRDGDALAERVRHALIADPARGWRLQDVARELGTSARSLQRGLGREGTSFRALLRRTRAEAAARLLERGAALAETGFACGYADQAHFTREFGTCVGLPPGAYRASLAGSSASDAPA